MILPRRRLIGGTAAGLLLPACARAQEPPFLLGGKPVIGASNAPLLVTQPSGAPDAMGFYSYPNAGQSAASDGAGYPLANNWTCSQVAAGYASLCGLTGSFACDVYGAGTGNRTGPEQWGNEIFNAVSSPAICNFSPAAATPILPMLSVWQTPENAQISQAQAQAITAGTYDSFFQGILSEWAALSNSSGWPANFQGKPWPTTVYVRIGYEFQIGTTQWIIDYNGTLLPYWIPMWQHIYTVMHTYAAANGINLSVCWNPVVSDNSLQGYDIRSAWPGNAYVDSIGLDIYEWVKCLDTPAIYTNAPPWPTGVHTFADLGAKISGGSMLVSPGYASLTTGSAAQLAGGTAATETAGLPALMSGTGSSGASARDALFRFLDFPGGTLNTGANGDSIQAAGGGSNNIGQALGCGLMDMIQWAAWCSGQNVGQGGVIGAHGSVRKTIPLVFPEFGIWTAELFTNSHGTVVADQNTGWTTAKNSLGATGVIDGIYCQSYNASGGGHTVDGVAEPQGTNMPAYITSRIKYARSLGVDVPLLIWFTASPNCWAAARPQLGTAWQNAVG